MFACPKRIMLDEWLAGWLVEWLLLQFLKGCYCWLLYHEEVFSRRCWWRWWVINGLNLPGKANNTSVFVSSLIFYIVKIKCPVSIFLSLYFKYNCLLEILLLFLLSHNQKKKDFSFKFYTHKCPWLPTLCFASQQS